MAEFGVSATNIQPVGNSLQPEQGVERPPVLLAGVNQIVEQVGDIFEGRRESRNQQFVSDFMAQQVTITDALEQGSGGVRTAAQARTLLRRNFLNAIQANPALREDLVKAQNDILGLFGDRELIQEGTIEEQRLNDRRDQLISSGMLSVNATDVEFAAADESARIAVASKERFDERMRTINMELALGNLSESRRNQLELERENEALRFVQDSSPAELQSMTGQFSAILNGAGSEAEKVQAIEDIFVGWRSEANALIGEVGTGEFTAFLKPFEQLRDMYVQRATGELTDAQVARETERILAEQRLLAVSDPAVANLAVASDLFSDSVFQRALGSSPEAFQAALRFLAGGDPENSNGGPNSAGANPNPFVTGNADKQGMDAYLGSVFRGLDSPNAETREESQRRVKSLIDSVEDYEGIIRRDPEAGIALVNWIASPPFQQARAQHPELFENIGPMVEVLRNHYDDEVWGMVSREFRNNSVSIMTDELQSMRDTGASNVARTEPTTSLIGARQTPSGMEFFVLDDSLEGQELAAARTRARSLNETLAPIINTTVKAGAHLQGRTDYGNVWNEVSTQILEGGMSDSPAADVGDELSIESFNTPASALDQALTTGGFVGDGDYTNAETPAEVAASFIGFEENSHRQVLSAFIRNTLGTDLDPAKTAWCAAFVNAALGASNAEGTDSLLARSFLNWGEPVATPKRGDVVVFRRGNSEWQGHVGFYVGEDSDGNIRVLGGNQDNKVSIQTYSRRDLLGIRRDSNERGNNSFASEQEAQAAFDRGEIGIGDIVTVNGQRMRIDEDG